MSQVFTFCLNRPALRYDLLCLFIATTRYVQLTPNISNKASFICSFLNNFRASSFSFSKFHCPMVDNLFLPDQSSVWNEKEQKLSRAIIMMLVLSPMLNVLGASQLCYKLTFLQYYQYLREHVSKPKTVISQ